MTITPGPWVVHTEAEYNIGRTTSVYVCRSDEPWPHGQLARVNAADELGSQMTNAYLMAAAPDMRDALEMQARADFAHMTCGECNGEGDWAHCAPCSVLFGRAFAARHAALTRITFPLEPQV